MICSNFWIVCVSNNVKTFSNKLRVKRLHDIMSVSEQEQATLAQGERRMTTMNEVHDIMRIRVKQGYLCQKGVCDEKDSKGNFRIACV